MPYRSTKRTWIKLWVDEWLGGTTRFELKPNQRAIWADLLAMAGKSRFPGTIASGVYEDGQFRGYPLSYLAGTLVYTEEEFAEALRLCEKHEKIKVDRTQQEEGSEELVIHVLNFERYQSEYLRQRAYHHGDDEDTPSEFKAMLGDLQEATDKVAFLVEAFKAWHGDAPPEDFDEVGGRVAGMLKQNHNDYGFLLKIMWETVTASIAGSHLNYMQGMMRGKQKDARQAKIRGAIDTTDPTRYSKGKYGHMVQR